MADDNDDSWLYGANHEEIEGDEKQAENSDADQNLNNPPGEVEEQQQDFEQQQFDEHNFEEAGEDEHHVVPEDESPKPGKASADQGEQLSEDDDNDDEDDDDDDDINVVIGDIKSGGSNFVKSLQDKQKVGTGSKFSIEEFESVGSIAGQPATEFSLDNIEDKPWRKPGADITDYFNYGFNEETWRAYCERQKRLRINESCVGLTGLAVGQNSHNVEQKQQGGLNNIKRMGRQKPIGTIDVIGSASSSQMNQNRPQAPRENVIQVMTADRREYSRTVVGNQQGPINFNPGNNDVYYNNDEPDPYSYGGYEPTQDTQQWENPGPNWAPREIKELTGGMSGNSQQQQSMMNIPPPSLHVQNMNPMMSNQNPMMIPPLVGSQMPSKPPMMMDSRDRRERDMQPRNYDQRKRMRSNSRERDRKDPRTSKDTVRESTRERESSQRDRRTRTDDRRERDERVDTSRRTDDRRDRSRDRKRSRSKERTKRSRSKDKKADDSKDRRSSTKK